MIPALGPEVSVAALLLTTEAAIVDRLVTMIDGRIEDEEDLP